MNCLACGKPALYRVGRRGFCGEHKRLAQAETAEASRRYLAVAEAKWDKFELWDSKGKGLRRKRVTWAT